MIMLLIVASIFLSGCIAQSEQRTSDETFGGQPRSNVSTFLANTPQSTPTPEVKYVYVTPTLTPEITTKESTCISGSNYNTNEYVSDICGIGSNLRFNAHDVTIRGSGSNFEIDSDVQRITIYATGSNIYYPRFSNPIIINYGTENNIGKY